MLKWLKLALMWLKRSEGRGGRRGWVPGGKMGFPSFSSFYIEVLRMRRREMGDERSKKGWIRRV